MTGLNNRLAIVGAEVAVGSVVGLAAFDDDIYHGRSATACVLPESLSMESLPSWLVESVLSQVAQVDPAATALVAVGFSVERFSHAGFSEITTSEKFSVALSQISSLLSKSEIESALLVVVDEGRTSDSDQAESGRCVLPQALP